MALNLALAVLLVATCWRVWSEIGSSEAREASLRDRPSEPGTFPPSSPVEPPTPVIASDYVQVAQEILLFRDRNPNVAIVTAPAKPLPPMPVAHGVLDLGSGPTVILSKAADSPQQAYQIGDTYEEFRIVDISSSALVFEWENERIRRSIGELMPEVTSASSPSPSVAPKSAPAKTKSSVLGEEAKAGPSEVEMGGDVRACRPGDKSPAGTVVDGYKKVVSQSPFGNVCRWVPAK